jgi:hypothetical protein
VNAGAKRIAGLLGACLPSKRRVSTGIYTVTLQTLSSAGLPSSSQQPAFTVGP